MPLHKLYVILARTAREKALEFEDSWAINTFWIALFQTKAIPNTELRDWLLHQEVVAQTVLETIKVTQR